MRVRGRLRRVTVTTVVCNSCGARGYLLAVPSGRIMLHRESSFTAHSWYGDVTEVLGANGAQLARADSGEAWVRANREALGYDR